MGNDAHLPESANFQIPSIALSGGVGAGKTTVCEVLQRNHGWLHIPEFMVSLSKSQRELYASGSPENKLEALIQCDSDRHSALQRNNDRMQILDRSVLDLLAHEYALSRMDVSYKNAKLAEVATATFEKLPRATYFLSIPNTLRLLRCKSSVGHIPELYFNAVFNKLFEEFFEIMSRVISVNFIDSQFFSAQNIASQIAKEAQNQEATINNKVAIDNLVSKLFQGW